MLVNPSNSFRFHSWSDVSSGQCFSRSATVFSAIFLNRLAIFGLYDSVKRGKGLDALARCPRVIVPQTGFGSSSGRMADSRGASFGGGWRCGPSAPAVSLFSPDKLWRPIWRAGVWTPSPSVTSSSRNGWWTAHFVAWPRFTLTRKLRQLFLYFKYLERHNRESSLFSAVGLTHNDAGL